MRRDRARRPNTLRARAEELVSQRVKDSQSVATDDVNKLVHELQSAGLAQVRVESVEPSLEDVFLALAATR